MACEQPGSGPMAAVVAVLTAGPGGAPVTVARLAHPGCAASQVVQGPQVLVMPSDGVTMRALAAVVPHPAGPRPLLLTELVAPVAGIPSPGERVDLATGVLLGLGLHLLATLWEPAPGAAGWRAVLGRGMAVVRDPDGGAYYDGSLDQSRQWRGLAGKAGAVELVCGTRGLGAAAETSVQVALDLLEAAARDGRLVGATIAAEVTR